MKKLTRILLLVTALCAAALAHARGVGMVLDVRGKAVAAMASKESVLDITSVLEPGAQVRLDSGASLSFVFYPTREMYSAAGPAVLAIAADGVTVVSGSKPGVKKMAEERAQTVQAYAGSSRPAGLLTRSLGNIIVSPRDGETVVNGEPEFSWRTRGTGAALRFVLLDGGEKVFEQAVTGSSLKLPPGVLAAQRRYRWEILADAPDARMEAAASFVTASAEQLEHLRRLEPAAAAEPEEWVIYALALEKVGANTLARRAWQRVARARPQAHEVGKLAQ